MKIELNISKISELLSKDFSMIDRGVLISLILSKDKDPQLHWAKFKAKSVVNNETKNSLMKLHKQSFIKWSGYKEAVTKSEDDTYKTSVKEVLSFMNELCGSKHRNNKSTTEGLTARLKEYSIDEVKLVVSNRYEMWKDDPVMNQHLTPQTIFRPSNFPKYLAHAEQTGIGEGKVDASKVDLKEGDILTTGNTITLSDRDTYSVRICRVGLDGTHSTVGSNVEVMYGKNIKRALRLMENKKKNGFTSDICYVYSSKK